MFCKLLNLDLDLDFNFNFLKWTRNYYKQDTMSIRSYLLRGIQALCFVWTLPLLAQFQISTDHPSALYQVGETAKFRVSNATAGTYSYRLYYDTHTNTIESGTFSITAKRSLEIPFQASKAGVVFCEVSSPSDTIKKAVAFSPFGINPLESSPSDFDQYWSCLLYTSPSPRDATLSRIPSSA